MTRNNWYVVTGGPSTGKTTLLAELENLGYQVIPEAARAVIDEAIANGITPQELRADEKKFQESVAIMKAKTESSLDPTVITFFDRGMHDTLAYMRYYSFVIDDWVNDLMDARYKKVFLLERLPQFESDYARTEDTQFVDAIDQLLQDAYTEHGMPPIPVPAVSVDARIKLVTHHINTRNHA